MLGCQSRKEHSGKNNFVLFMLGIHNAGKNDHVLYGNPTQSGAVVIQESREELLVPVAYCARVVG